LEPLIRRRLVKKPPRGERRRSEREKCLRRRMRKSIVEPASHSAEAGKRRGKTNDTKTKKQTPEKGKKVSTIGRRETCRHSFRKGPKGERRDLNKKKFRPQKGSKTQDHSS